jgi:hypothetical protein
MQMRRYAQFTRLRNRATATDVKSSITCLVAATVLAAVGPAQAHHPVASPLPPTSRGAGNNLGLRSRVGLQHEVAEFRLPGRGEGQWHATTLYGEYLFLQRFSVGASLPLAHIRYRDKQRPWGLGDAEFTTRARVLDALGGRLNLLVGLGLEVPTGSTQEGLGDGHVMVSPQIGLIYTARNLFSLALTISDHIGFERKADNVQEQGPANQAPANQPMHGGSHGSSPSGSIASNDKGGSVLAPHSEHEMRTQLTAMYQYRSLYGFVSPSAIIQWTAHDAFGPVELSGGLGVMPVPTARLELKVGAPLYGEHRSNWRASLGVEFWF